MFTGWISQLYKKTTKKQGMPLRPTLAHAWFID